MSTSATLEAPAQTAQTAQLVRILAEGHGPGAWHGPDLKAALAEVTPEQAFWRPGPGRHCIAEIALHQAWCARSVRAQLSGRPAGPFVTPGEDWFALEAGRDLGWHEVLAALEAEQRELAGVVSDLAAGRASSPLAAQERFDLVLGVACHAIYHAGQVQLLKRLQAGG